MPKSKYGIVTESVPAMPDKATGKAKVHCYHVYLPTESRPTIKVDVEYVGGKYEWREFADREAADEYMDTILGHED